MKENVKNRRKYIGLTIAILMVMGLAIPMLTTVAPIPIWDELDAVINTAQDGAWNVGATWVGGTPPATGDDAVILNTHDVTLPANTLTGSCEIQSGGTLTGGIFNYIMTCDDENGAGFIFDNDGTISTLSLTFTFAGATSVDLEGTFIGNPTAVVCNHADLNITQTTATTMATFTVTAGSWDCNDEALTVTGAVNIDDELCGGDSLIKIGGNADFTGGDFYRETSTIQMTSSLSLTQDTSYFYDWIIDDSVTVTVVGAMGIAYNSLEIDGTTGGGFSGTATIYPTVTNPPAQAFFCGANADFGTCTFYLSVDSSTKIDGCAGFDDFTVYGSGDYTVTLTNRSMTCVDFTIENTGMMTEITFDTSTFDFYSTGDFDIDSAGVQKHGVFDCQSNDIIFGNSVIVASNGNITSDSADIYITGDWTTNTATDIEWGTSNTTINGTAQQTITTGAFPFHNLTIDNSHASQEVIFVSDLDVDGNLTFTDGQVDFDTNNIDIDTARNVSISNISVITHGTGNWYFDGDTNFTEDNATAQNIGNINVTGTLTLLSDCHAENVSVNDTGFLDMTANQILTLNGNSTFNISGTFNRGLSIWNLNGTIDQTITSSEKRFYRINVYNTDGIITFVNDTNTTYLVLLANTTMVLNSNMTVSRLYCTGLSDSRVNVSSDGATVRYLFNPLMQRYVEYTDFNSVTLVPAGGELPPSEGGSSPSPYPTPQEIDEEPEPEDEDNGEVCNLSLFVSTIVGICIGTGVIVKFIDPRKKEDK